MAKYQSTHTGAEIDAGIDLLNSNSATSGQVLTANGTGGASWQDVDDGFVAKVIPSNTLTYVYARDGDGDKSLRATTTMTGNTIAYRDAKGNISVGDPVGQYNAVHKAYVDNRFRYTHLIEVEFNPAPEPYVSYVLIGTITYVSEVSAPLTSIDDLPLDVALPIHGMFAPDSTENHETYTATRKTRSNGTSCLDITYLYYNNNNGVTKETQGDIVPTKFTDTVL